MKPSASSLAKLSIIGLATAAAVVLPRSPWLLQVYAAQIYPRLQSRITAWSNSSPLALFDATLIILVAVVLGAWIAALRTARRRRSAWPIVRAVSGTMTGAAIVYLWFLLGWGLNYARPPIESVVPYDEARVTPGAVRALADHAVREANRTYAPAHAAGFPAIDGVPPSLVAALHAVERDLGRPERVVPARPKHSLLSPYFRAAGVSGMLAPFWLETLLNPDLTGPERPYVLAHEWAHLSGFAPESDASFVGLLAALRADAPSQYSAWLELVGEAVNQLQPVTRRLVLANLDPGPRADQEAIAERLRSLVQPVERAAWVTYDKALKSQGVVDGVRGYSRVVQLILGTNALETIP